MRFSVFDQHNRTPTTHEELARYRSSNPNDATFKETRQKDAFVYEFVPGLDVHVPCMAAHWAHNHETPSEALSMNFDLRSSVTRLGRIYQINGALRVAASSQHLPVILTGAIG